MIEDYNAELCDSCDNEDCELKFSVKEKVFECEDYLRLDDEVTEEEADAVFDDDTDDDVLDDE